MTAPTIAVAANLRTLRESRGMSGSELAELLDVTHGAVSQWENNRGYPTIGNLVRIAVLFGITLDDLVLGEVKIVTTVTVVRT